MTASSAWWCLRSAVRYTSAPAARARPDQARPRATADGDRATGWSGSPAARTPHDGRRQHARRVLDELAPASSVGRSSPTRPVPRPLGQRRPSAPGRRPAPRTGAPAAAPAAPSAAPRRGTTISTRASATTVISPTGRSPAARRARPGTCPRPSCGPRAAVVVTEPAGAGRGQRVDERRRVRRRDEHDQLVQGFAGIGLERAQLAQAQTRGRAHRTPRAGDVGVGVRDVVGDPGPDHPVDQRALGIIRRHPVHAASAAAGGG